MIHLDILSGFVRSEKGNIAILVMTDALTKWVVCVPIKNKTASTIAEKFFNHWVLQHSFPEEVTTDGGSEIKGMYDRLCLLLKVKHIVINAYHPSENAQVERKNKVISDFLSKHCQQDQSNWDEFVRLAAFHYNCSRHVVTKQIPFCLERGINPRLEIDQILNTSISQNEDMNINLWNKEVVPKLSKALNSAA